MTDIAPELIESINGTFKDIISKSAKYKKLKLLSSQGKASYADAHSLAIEIGDALVKSYKLKLSSDVLPEGRMFYNIAERLIYETLAYPQEDLADYCESVQKSLNESTGIGMKAAVPERNTDRLDGLIERLSNEANFDDVEWILDDPIKNLLQSEVDDFVKKNAEIQTEAGLRPKIVRTLAGRACKWCRNLAGTYDYSDVSDTGNPVFRRHENCRCKVEYVPPEGRRQNVWTKIQY